MQLQNLYKQLSKVFDGQQPIEVSARAALLDAASTAEYSGESNALRQPFLEVMQYAGAHPVCKLIADAALPWAPPKTSGSPHYVKDSLCKSHVEILGPSGLVLSDTVRIGLYGMMPHSAYGVRTHPAEETYVMLAGEAYWKRGDNDYALSVTGERSYHPSMLEHATRTGEHAFMSIYAWVGDISTDNYLYSGN